MDALHQIKGKPQQVDNLMRNTDYSDALKFCFFGLFANEVARIIDAAERDSASD